MFSLMRRTPLFPEMGNFEREADRFFRNFWSPAPVLWEGKEKFVFEPAVNVYEEGDNTIVEAQVPGLKKEELHVEMLGDRLTLRGETKQETEKKERNYHVKELRYGSFERVVPLPYEVAADKVKAELKEGVVKITLPKSEAAKESVREIEVKAA